mmetsp:Transcript_228/g.512  ORF Transcript_228/g.512 Transcript_228/m.512 type:complete len:149 (-) Transcript_228:675-1121(-)
MIGAGAGTGLASAAAGATAGETATIAVASETATIANVAAAAGGVSGTVGKATALGEFCTFTGFGSMTVPLLVKSTNLHCMLLLFPCLPPVPSSVFLCSHTVVGAGRGNDFRSGTGKGHEPLQDVGVDVGDGSGELDPMPLLPERIFAG